MVVECNASVQGGGQLVGGAAGGPLRLRVRLPGSRGRLRGCGGGPGRVLQLHPGVRRGGGLVQDRGLPVSHTQTPDRRSAQPSQCSSYKLIQLLKLTQHRRIMFAPGKCVDNKDPLRSLVNYKTFADFNSWERRNPGRRRVGER